LSNQVIDVCLVAPLRFDESIGYWTGEVDHERLASVLTAVPAPAGVDRSVAGDRVVLRGEASRVRAHAAALIAAGLVDADPR
jgi:hypothetical protein